MPKKLFAIAALTATILTSMAPASWAETMVEKVKRTGVITAGARTDAMPFSFKDKDGKLTGYSLDLLEYMRARMEKELGRPIKLEFKEVTTANRIAMVQERKVDIECGATSFTWNRTRFVDFSVTYFFSGTQFLVIDKRIQGPSSLAGKKVGVIRGTSNEGAVRNLKPMPIIVFVKDRAEGLKALMEGKIDAMAGDGVLLDALRSTLKNGDSMALVPAVPINVEAYACMIPQNESAWRNAVNRSILGFISGIVDGRPQQMAIVDKWFGPKGLNYPMDLNIQNFKGIINSLERVPSN